MPERTSSSPRARRALQTFAIAAFSALGFVLASCTEKITQPPPDEPDAFAVPDSIQEVFTANCGIDGCHGGANPQKGMQLGVDARTSYENIVNVTAVSDGAFKRIAPGDSADSYLVMKLRNDPRIVGQPMPFGGYPMDPALVMKIAAWAAQGAPGEPIFTAAGGGRSAPLSP